MLETRNLVKGFKDKEVLTGVNLKVEDASVFGLVGVNGAGKSTLLRTIAGVYEPEHGEVLLNARNTCTDPLVRKKIAYVSDEAYFPVGSTISSLKSLYRDLYDFDEKVFQKYRKMMELDENKPIASFSKGMKRKTALLFALSIHPELMLLDEAYDGLEPIARLRFKNTLTSLMEDEKLSVIIASHNLKELEDICDSFGILNNGRIEEYGDLMTSKEQIQKYQIAFTNEKTMDDFHQLHILHAEKEGQVWKLIVKGDPDQNRRVLEDMRPILINTLPVNFEELFIYTVEKGDDKYE